MPRVSTMIIILLAAIPALVFGNTAKLQIRTDVNWEPFEFVDDGGEPDGFNVDLITAVMEALNLEYELKAQSWANIREELAAGHIDLTPGMFFSERRDIQYGFSLPHTYAPQTFFTRTGEQIAELNELHNREILVTENHITEEILKERMITDFVITTESSEKALKLLATGVHDAVFADKIESLYMIKKFGIKNLKASFDYHPPLALCMAVTEGNDELLYLLDEGLNIINLDGTYDEIHKKWFGGSKLERTLLSYRKPLLISSIILSAVLLLLILWNITLKRIVDRKTSILQNEIRGRKKNETILINQKQEMEEVLLELDFLISEILGRVMKNLEILREMSREHYTDDESKADQLEAFLARLDALSELHRQIYSSGNDTTVNLGSYLDKLIDSFKARFTGSTGNLTFITESDSFELEYEKAAALGLLVNEAVSNSMKHAFSDEAQGLVEISIEKYSDGRAELRIADNGRGIAMDEAAGLTFGITLMNILADQLAGQLKISSKNGTSISIIFPCR